MLLIVRKNRGRFIIWKWEWLFQFSSGHIEVEIVYFIILFCLVMNSWSLCQLMTAGKFSSPSLALLSKLQHQADEPEAQMLLSFGWPGWPYRGTHAALPKAEILHIIHPVSPEFDGLGTPCSAVAAWPEQALWASFAHFPCIALQVAGLQPHCAFRESSPFLNQRPYSSGGTSSKWGI